MLLMCVTRALTNSQLCSEGGDSLQAANVHCLLIDLSIDCTDPPFLQPATETSVFLLQKTQISEILFQSTFISFLRIPRLYWTER
jgi:hypothetical protein